MLRSSYIGALVRFFHSRAIVIEFFAAGAVLGFSLLYPVATLLMYVARWL